MLLIWEMREMGHLKIVMVVVALLASMAAVGADGSPSSRPAAELRALRAALQKQVVEGLRDPASAQFRRSFLSASEGDGKVIALCGEVNAKNAYGGFVGFGAFIINEEGLVIFEASEPRGTFGAVWPVWCARPIALK